MLTFVPSSSYNKYWQLSSPLSPHHVHQESPLKSTPTTAVSPLGTPLHLDSFKIPLSFLSDLWYRAQTTDHIQSHALIFYVQPHDSVWFSIHVHVHLQTENQNDQSDSCRFIGTYRGIHLRFIKLRFFLFFFLSIGAPTTGFLPTITTRLKRRGIFNQLPGCDYLQTYT